MTLPCSRDVAYADALDAVDPLGRFRDRFVNAEPDLIYLDGNSLGRLPESGVGLATELVQQQWGGRLIRGWNEGWFTLPERVGGKIAGLIGADPDEVIVADSTSVNLFKLALAVLRVQVGRRRIVSDNLNFPSDVYVLQGICELLDRGHTLELVPSADGMHGPAEELAARCTEDTALLTLSHTAFKSGYVYDMAALTAAAQAQGALVLWDLSHSVGAVPLDLHAANVDMAIGCTYKYLNGGPGAPAFLYVRRDLQERLSNPIAGWMGQERLFDFDLQYRPAAGMRRFLSGTPTVLSLAMIEPGLDLLLEAGIESLRAKSLQQSEYLIGLWQELLAPRGFRLNSPRDGNRRGSHVSLGHDQGLGIDLALIHEMNVLPDFRAPDNIRLGIAPLYTSYRDIHSVVGRLCEIVDSRLHEKYAGPAPVVT